MKMYLNVIFCNVTMLKVWLYEFTKDFIVLLSGRCRALGRAISAQLYEHILLCRAT